MNGRKSSKALGKYGESKVLSELFKRNFDVYRPMTDTVGIDLVVRTKNGRFNEIQVKTREPRTSDKGEIFESHIFEPRDNYFLIYHLKDSEDFWVLPSKVFVEKATHIHASKKLRVWMNPKRLRELEKYKNNFEQLRG